MFYLTNPRNYVFANFFENFDKNAKKGQFEKIWSFSNTIRKKTLLNYFFQTNPLKYVPAKLNFFKQSAKTRKLSSHKVTCFDPKGWSDTPSIRFSRYAQWWFHRFLRKYIELLMALRHYSKSPNRRDPPLVFFLGFLVPKNFHF